MRVDGDTARSPQHAAWWLALAQYTPVSGHGHSWELLPGNLAGPATWGDDGNLQETHTQGLASGTVSLALLPPGSTPL